MSFGSRLSRYLLLLPAVAGVGRADTFGIGFFEGGAYPAHAEFRGHFRDQLKVMTPPGIDLRYIPDGFKSAEWDRQKSRVMAAELAQNPDIDLVVALGPWTVEDLLAAGFDRPIVAALRYQPVLEGLVDDRGRPLADNLTVRVRRNKLVSDLTQLASLAPVRKLGLLYFPSSDETERLLAAAREVGERLGFEVITGEGYDRNGTYAFFKAYAQVAGKVDAIYLPPLWGFNSDKMRQFYAMLARDKVISLAAEGQTHASRGALAAGSRESSLARAHYQAWKVVRLMTGATPADLPTVFEDEPGLVVNESTARQLGMNIRTDRRYDLTLLEAPPPDDVERLTVVDAVNVAMAQNPDYQSRYAALEAAEAAASEARSSYLPHLSLAARVDHFNPHAVNNDDRYRADRFRAGLRLDQELFAPAVLRDIQQASLQREVVASDLRQAGLDLELGVTLAFLNVVRAEQVTAVLRMQVRQVRECLQLARLRLDLGEAEAAPVWRWESELLGAMRAALLSETDVAVGRIMLNTILGRPADYPFVADWQHFSDARLFREEAVLTQMVTSPGGRDRMVASLIDLAIANNPQLSRSDLQIDLGRSRLARNRADFLPKIGFSASLSLARERSDRPEFEEQNPSWSVGAGLKLPLFLGGRRFKERYRLRAELDRLQYRRDLAALEINSRLSAAIEQMLGQAEAFPIAARAAKLADQYVPDIQSGFGAGSASTTDLLDAVQNDRDAGLRAITTHIEYYRQVAEVANAVGISANETGRAANEELFSHIALSLSGERN